MQNKKYIYLENYTYLNIVRDTAILKNTLNGFAFLTDKTESIDVLKKIFQSETATAKINVNKHKNLISTIKENFLGDIVELKKKPVQIFHTLPNNSKIVLNKDRDVFDNLFEITFFLNSYNEYLPNEFYSKQYEYFLWENDLGTLPIENIISILESSDKTKQMKINICGGNIINYLDIMNLSNYLIENKYENVNYYMTYNQYLNNIDLVKNILRGNITILVDAIEVTSISKNQTTQNISFNFFINNPDQYIEVENFIETNNITNYLIIPIIDNINDFIDYELGIDVQEIIYDSINMSDIIINSSYNRNFLSKIFVYPNGNISPIKSSSSKIKFNSKSDIKRLISKELSNESISWKFIRRKVKPCEDCLLVDLCPPISNYEVSLNKFDLCNHSDII